METLKICKVRDVRTPNRAHPEDAGIDFYVPFNIDVDTFNEKCMTTGDAIEYKLNDAGNVTEMVLRPGESVLLPSGIKVKVPSGYMLQFTNKSGVRGGGTLGNISATQVSVRSVDIGLPQLAMHSCFETSGTLDNEYMVKAIKEYYESNLSFDENNNVLISK